MKKIMNTYFPFPFKISRKGIFFGRKIHQINGLQWEDEKVHKSDWYINCDPVAQVLLDQITEYVDKNETVLDVCCNVGRHLNYLNNCGYKNLYGFDIMKPAIEKMKILFPDLDAEKIRLGNAVDILPSYTQNSFDWAYTHSATIELIHPSFYIHYEMARIVRKGLIFLLNEGNQGYSRNYESIFNRAGFVTAKKMLVKSEKGYSFTLYVWIKRNFLSEYISPDYLIR
jgi:SAM-dependent methyltransferase